MNTEPEKIREKKQKSHKPLQALMQQTPARLLRMLTHNWQWKLLALFVAICLWAGLISQDATLTRERVFSDVPIGVTGADSLRRNSGLIVVSGLESENLTARMRVQVPQREYASATASNYNPRVELTRVTEAGEQTLKVATTATSTYGSVTDIYPSSVTVVVDEYVTNYRVPVTVETTGSYPEGFWGGNLELDPSVVAVSGPKTVVDRIARIRVELDLSSLSPRSGDVRIALPIRFLDAEGESIESDLLEVTSADVVLRTIILEQTLYPVREIPLSVSALTSGEPAEGYRVAAVSVSPETVRAAGSAETLDAIETLLVDAVDVTGAMESFSTNVRLRKTGGLQMLEPDVVVVSVEIEPESVTRTFDSLKLSAEGMSSSQSVILDTRKVAVAVTGPQLALKSLRASDITAYVNASGLEEGTYELPVEFRVENAEGTFTFASTPATVQAEIQGLRP